MDLQALFEDNDIWDLPEEKLKEIEEIEFETYLDNLGYISILQNDDEREIDWDEIEEGIAKFREEYIEAFHFFSEHPGIFTELFPHAIVDSSDVLNLKEEEINFMAHLSSLEGEFEMHKLSKTKIKKNKILKRVLNFRLSILGFPASNRANQFGQEINQSLLKLTSWLGIDSFQELVQVIGDMEDLSKKLVDQEPAKNTVYPHIVYFFDKKGNIKGDIESDKERFKYRLELLPDAVMHSITDIDEGKLKKKAFLQLVNTEKNLFATRLIQIRLWLLGTYDGKLDSDLGQLTVKAIKDLVSYLHKTFSTRAGTSIDPESRLGISVTDFIMRIGGRHKFFALNATFLLKYVFPIFIEDSSNEKNEKPISEEKDKKYGNSIAYDISRIGNKLNEKEQENFYRRLDTIIIDDLREPKKRIVNTKGSKGLFKSIKRFFRNLINHVKKGIDIIITGIKKLFKWIKNGIKILLSELKKVFYGIRETVKSFFGRKVIKSENSGQFLSTSFDGDFDSISILNNLDAEMLKVHIAKNYEFLDNLRRGSKFLGICIHVILNLSKPGFGWLKVGLTILRELQNKQVEPYKKRYAEIYWI